MAQNHTKTEAWSVDDLVSAATESTSKTKIQIPKFQRTLVWLNPQKKTFVDSIKKGFPVGALLLYKVGEKDGITSFTLIDGLQRTTTLKQYTERPTSSLFFDETNVDDSIVEGICNLLDDTVNKKDLRDEIVNWITTLTGFEESNGFSSFQLSSHLNTGLKLELGFEKAKAITDSLIPHLATLKTESNIADFKIPVLIYTGPQENLPTIFERLNSKGTQLSKYQIYAASWQHYQLFSITNREIITQIKNKYDKLIEEGYEVENYDSSPKFYTTQFSVFEYLFGFGKHLSSKYEYLFTKNTRSEQEDSIGFNLVNICLGIPFSEMSKIPDKIKDIDLPKFERSIINSVDFVNDSLKGHIALKMNKRTRIPIVHSEMQIVSMIGRAFHLRYDSSMEEKADWSIKKNNLRANLKFHYLYDILRDAWKGAGDNQAYNLISSDRYERVITKKQWTNVLEEWLDQDLNKKEKARISLKDSTILFYKYLYTHTLSAYEELSDTEFDIEHLVPVDRLKALVGEGSGLPISAFPNICLLESTLNRSKGSYTFYEYYDEQINRGDVTKEQSESEIAALEAYTFTDKSEMEFVTSAFTEDNYNAYLMKRYSIVIEKFFELYKIQ